MSATEGFWRMIGTDIWPIQRMAPTVQTLEVHLPKNPGITFRKGEARTAATSKRKQRSTLTQFFETCKREKSRPLSEATRTIRGKVGPHAYELKYHEMPMYYRWDKKERRWVRRQKYEDKIGRMWDFNVSQKELFYLRRLLVYAVGPTSFGALKKGCKTFKEAAYKQGLFVENKGIFKQNIFRHFHQLLQNVEFSVLHFFKS